jgi:flagella basal body P-ring formation protein FlgA
MRAGTFFAALRFAAGLFLALGAPALAQEMRAPSPKHVIYPGDLITQDMLTETPISAQNNAGPIALAPEDIVGMMAGRTLLPGLSIPISALRPPRVVRAGAAVSMIYIDNGLVITAAGDALQDGVVGEMVKLRNEDSGVTVTGRVRADGSVLVGG